MKFFRLALLLISLQSNAARPFGVVSSSTAPIGTASFAKRSPNSAATVVLRGGAAFDDNEEDSSHNMPPRMSAQDMAIALRWTGEVNRRLHEGTRPASCEVADALKPLASTLQPLLLQQQQGNHGLAHHTMRGGETTATATSSANATPLTLFHAKSPRPSGQGAARWGPSLEAYVAHICRQLHLEVDADGAGAPELSLALMYLDRASSAETPRSNGVPAVPFLQPRTAHRLVLAALLLATHTTHGWPLPALMERVESLGIPPTQLTQMLQWMSGALGDPGFFVTHEAMQSWRHSVLTQTKRLRPLMMTTEIKQEEEETSTSTASPSSVERRHNTASTTTTTTTTTELSQDDEEDVTDEISSRARLEAA